MNSDCLTCIIPDADYQHVKILNQEICKNCKDKICLSLCPSEVFCISNTDETKILISYQKCIECGACYIGCPLANIDFNYPRSGYGVVYYEG